MASTDTFQLHATTGVLTVKSGATIDFEQEEDRAKFVAIRTEELPITRTGHPMQIEGLAKQYTTEPMDIPKVHSNTWGNQWQAGRLKDAH